MRFTGVLVTLAVLLAAAVAKSATDCNITDAAALSRCIKRLLEQSRDKVRSKVDPLRLGNHHDGDLTATDIVVRGLADYNVDGLSVTFPAPQKIAVRATISWSRITGDLYVKIRKCKRIIFKMCITVRAKPHVQVHHAVGTLTTTLIANVSPSGKLSISSSGTHVHLNLPRISVKANVRGFIGFMNRLVGDPGSRIASKLTNKWWRHNKGKVEREARDALDKAVREEVAVNLAKLGHF